mgnify:CR=1 FL=1
MTRYPRGCAYPFPLAYYLLDVFKGGVHECWLLVWDQERTDRGIPSIFK